MNGIAVNITEPANDVILPNRTIDHPSLKKFGVITTLIVIVIDDFYKIHPSVVLPQFVKDLGDMLIEIEGVGFFFVVLPCTTLHILDKHFQGIIGFGVSPKLVRSPVVAVPIPIKNSGHIVIIGVDFLHIVHPFITIPILENNLTQFTILVGKYSQVFRFPTTVAVSRHSQSFKHIA